MQSLLSCAYLCVSQVLLLPFLASYCLKTAVDMYQVMRNLTSWSFADYIRQHIDVERTHNINYYHPSYDGKPRDSGTTHLSVQSPDGAAVAATSTVNLQYVSKSFLHRTCVWTLTDSCKLVYVFDNDIRYLCIGNTARNLFIVVYTTTLSQTQHCSTGADMLVLAQYALFKSKIRCVYKLRIALHRNSASELWDVTCHMGSHSVTCHPTHVNAATLTLVSKLVLDLPTPEGWKAELTQATRQCNSWESNSRSLDHKSDVLTTTPPSHQEWLPLEEESKKDT